MEEAFLNFVINFIEKNFQLMNFIFNMDKIMSV